MQFDPGMEYQAGWGDGKLLNSIWKHLFMLWTIWLQQKVLLMSLQNPPERNLLLGLLLQQHYLAFSEKATLQQF